MPPRDHAGFPLHWPGAAPRAVYPPIPRPEAFYFGGDNSAKRLRCKGTHL